MHELEQQGYTIDTDRSKLDIDAIHSHLSQTYWAKGIPRGIVEKAIANSLCFGIYHHGSQVGFARVISDCATFAYLADVFVIEAHRGKGLSKWLIASIKSHPELQGLRRWALVTRDAQGLYSQFEFTPLSHPERFMEIARPDIYLSAV